MTRYVEFSIAKTTSHPVNAMAPPLQPLFNMIERVGRFVSANPWMMFPIRHAMPPSSAASVGSAPGVSKKVTTILFS